MAEYVLSELADRDLAGISRYSILNFGVGRARQYKASLRMGMKTAALFPSIGRPYTTKQGTIFQQYNSGRHAIFYQPSKTGIFVVRVLHLMMNFDDHLE